jgi:choice-of-anchor A domain-containing protein
MPHNHDRGIALVLALFLMSAMSVLAASLMFLSQTETYASMNYRMMSQARYAGEAAVQKASDFLLDGAQYAVPTATNVVDPLANYDRSSSPVRCAGGGCTAGQPIVLSATASVASNYPAAAVQTAFDTAAQGSLAAGPITVNYGAYATLKAMQEFQAFGGTQNVVQIWEITGVGSLAGSRPATVEVVAIVETPKVPANNYSAFATDDHCGAMTFAGSTQTDSYDSRDLTGATAPSPDEDGGDVGTNGNLTISGGAVDIYGNLYSPRTGVGECTAGAVTALTTSDIATVSGSIVQLPTVVTYPAPPLPAPSLTAAVSLSSAGTTLTTCAALGLTPVTNCNVSGNTITIQGTNIDGTPLALPSLTLDGMVSLVLTATSGPAEFNFNSITLEAGAEIKVAVTAADQAVLVNIAGKNPDNSDIAIPVDLVGGTFAAADVSGCAACSTYDAAMLQFVYGGTGEIKMAGHTDAAATIYAPNAAFTLEGTADLYGSILAKTVNIAGSANIHYDRRLAEDFYVMGRPMVGTFTWKRY